MGRGPQRVFVAWCPIHVLRGDLLFYLFIGCLYILYIYIIPGDRWVASRFHRATITWDHIIYIYNI